MMKIENNTVREKVREIKHILYDCTNNNTITSGCLIIKRNQLKEFVDNLLSIIKIYEKEIEELNTHIEILESNNSSNIKW